MTREASKLLKKEIVMKRMALRLTIAASALALAAACTVTTTDDDDNGGAAGSGQTGGAAGSGGTGGSGETGGTAGSGQTGGTAGSGQTGGTAGSGQTGGAAGSGGTGGTAGSGQTGGAAGSAGSAYTCDDIDDSDECGACVVGNCCSEAEACLNDPLEQCWTSIECLNACPDDYETCKANCDDGNFNPLYNDLVTCMEQSCFDQCGTGTSTE
ncbi:MAG: hypothetical protein CSA75_01250 [Sorangium cellulosum]|nr:MAG: hypothetical protein CSA75_01250 [Sorangium cellulosum]